MKLILILALFVFGHLAMAQTNAISLSQKLLYAARVEQPTDTFYYQLQNISVQDLQNQLDTDDNKKTFWLNLYNAIVLSKLKNNPKLYENRNAFYTTKIVNVAQKELSLDDLEHGILRHSKIKLSLGYLNKLWANNFEKKMRVKTLDFRVHFALNCGAKSCPPIAFYSPENLDKQLELATQNYLNNACHFDESKNEVHLPMIFSWFRADFGGKSGMKILLKKYQVIPELKTKIVFDPYNWDLELNNFLEIK
jgi:hypothetical protein